MFHFTVLTAPGDGLLNCSTENRQRICACDRIKKWMVCFEIDVFDKASFFANNRAYKCPKTREMSILNTMIKNKTKKNNGFEIGWNGN